MYSQLQHQELSSTVYVIIVCLVVYFGPIPGSHDPKQNIRSEDESNCKFDSEKNRTAINYQVHYTKSDNKRYLKKKQMSMLYFVLKYTDKTYRMWAKGVKGEKLKVKSEIVTRK